MGEQPQSKQACNSNASAQPAVLDGTIKQVHLYPCTCLCSSGPTPAEAVQAAAIASRQCEGELLGPHVLPWLHILQAQGEAEGQQVLSGWALHHQGKAAASGGVRRWVSN